jgi:hypothetical protein
LKITFGLVQKAKAVGVSEAVAKATAAATLTAEREELVGRIAKLEALRAEQESELAVGI